MSIKPMSANIMRWMAIVWPLIGAFAAVQSGPLAFLMCVVISSVFLVGGSIVAHLDAIADADSSKRNFASERQP